MADSDFTQYSFRQRLLAVLDYDGIPQGKRTSHVAIACGCSRSTARRLLTLEKTARRMNSRWLFDLAHGLNVSWRWLYDNKYDRLDPRSARIQLVMLEGDTVEQADMIINTVACEVSGEPTYAYFGNAVDLPTAFIFEQHRRLTEWEKNKNLRFMLRLINNDPKANRLLEMCARGQISKRQIFHIV